jgi:redox-sensitive bicupin YhaK (pirin superfamily)
MSSMSSTRRVVHAADRNVITSEQFGSPGLVAREPIGPDAPVTYSGAVFVLHDSIIEAGCGIGHHPHQGMERLFYVLSGGLHHDDALNNITADAAAGDLAIFTEGRRGMIHSESNPAADDARIWIIVAPTDPVPPTASVRVLSGDDAGRDRPGDGMSVKELIGPGSPAQVHSDVRWLVDLRIRDDAVFRRELGHGEAVVAQPIRGRAKVMGESLGTDDLLAVGPDDEDRTLEITGDGEPSRLLVAVTGPGLGFRTPADAADGRAAADTAGATTPQAGAGSRS